MAGDPVVSGRGRVGLSRLGALPIVRWGAWMTLGLFLVWAGGHLLDHRVARYVHERLAFSRTARRLVHIPELVIAASLAGVVVLGAWSALVGRLEGVWRQLLLASISVCIAIALTDALKIWFGRIPPLRWYDQQWRNFYAYLAGSFPSGHMTAISAVIPILWPVSRWIVLLLVIGGAAGAYGLVRMQAHFISDLFGGMMVGGTVGYAVLCADRRR
ncbi:phosphatase PAP2 family protein [Lichenicoccus roseus]|uniref:Phosphatase PAP2 family protein n=1 Tax=Lichenicoccus roseus TaxID=2683649 RepID=A0A5R9JD07_9PROT|nr:phosphatase PAP2 family protein [Lichenicoccus roseus]TLU74417.1 phosphatase PAP2 family protein [Lichenicoccus roseus]